MLFKQEQLQLLIYICKLVTELEEILSIRLRDAEIERAIDTGNINQMIPVLSSAKEILSSYILNPELEISKELLLALLFLFGPKCSDLPAIRGYVSRIFQLQWLIDNNNQSILYHALTTQQYNCADYLIEVHKNMAFANDQEPITVIKKFMSEKDSSSEDKKLNIYTLLALCYQQQWQSLSDVQAMTSELKQNLIELAKNLEIALEANLSFDRARIYLCNIYKVLSDIDSEYLNSYFAKAPLHASFITNPQIKCKIYYDLATTSYKDANVAKQYLSVAAKLDFIYVREQIQQNPNMNKIYSEVAESMPSFSKKGYRPTVLYNPILDPYTQARKLIQDADSLTLDTLSNATEYYRLYTDSLKLFLGTIENSFYIAAINHHLGYISTEYIEPLFRQLPEYQRCRNKLVRAIEHYQHASFHYQQYLNKWSYQTKDESKIIEIQQVEMHLNNVIRDKAITQCDLLSFIVKILLPMAIQDDKKEKLDEYRTLAEVNYKEAKSYFETYFHQFQSLKLSEPDSNIQKSQEYRDELHKNMQMIENICMSESQDFNLK